MTGLPRDRLAKLLGMLGSAHDGEIAAAGRAADALVRKAGLTWPEVLEPKSLPALRSPLDDVGGALDQCLANTRALTAWEISFCFSLSRQRKPPTAKQYAVLLQVLDKVHRA